MKSKKEIEDYLGMKIEPYYTTEVESIYGEEQVAYDRYVMGQRIPVNYRENKALPKRTEDAIKKLIKESIEKNDMETAFTCHSIIIENTTSYRDLKSIDGLNKEQIDKLMKYEQEAREKAEEQARLKAEQEAKEKAEEQARLKAEQEAKEKEEEQARLKAEQDAKERAEEQARLKAEQESKEKEEEQARIKAEQDAKERREEQARIKAEQEKMAKIEEERQATIDNDIKEYEQYEELIAKKPELKKILEELKYEDFSASVNGKKSSRMNELLNMLKSYPQNERKLIIQQYNKLADILIDEQSIQQSDNKNDEKNSIKDIVEDKFFNPEKLNSYAYIPEVNYDELKYFLENYPEHIPGWINLKLNERDLSDKMVDLLANHIKMDGQDGFMITEFNVEFANITDLDIHSIQAIENLIGKQPIECSKTAFKYKDSQVPEKDSETVKKEIEEFKKITEGITDQMSDIEKFKIIYTRIAEKVKYNNDYYENNKNSFHIVSEPDDNQNLEGIVNGKTVCGGYSAILSQALNCVNIDCISRIGHNAFKQLHAWNQVEIEGNWYNCDLSADVSRIGSIYKTPACCLLSDESFEKKGYKDFHSVQQSPMIEKKICETDYDQEYIHESFHSYAMEQWEKGGAIEQQTNGHDKTYEEVQQEKIRPQDESIKDEIGDEFKEIEKQKTDTQKLSVDLWMNRFGSWYGAIDRVSQGAKAKFVKMKSDIVKAISNKIKERSNNKDANKDQEQNQGGR